MFNRVTPFVQAIQKYFKNMKPSFGSYKNVSKIDRRRLYTGV